MGEIHECGATKAVEISDQHNSIYDALRELDHELFENKTNEQIWREISQLQLKTENGNFFDIKSGQFLVYNEGIELSVKNKFDTSCPFPEEEKTRSLPMTEIPFPHLVAFPQLRSARVRQVIQSQKETRSDIRDFCAKFTGYHLYYITGDEGVLSQDAWTLIPYLTKNNLAEEISNGEKFLQIRGNNITAPDFNSPGYQQHLKTYIERIKLDDTPKALGLHYARTSYSSDIIQAGRRNSDIDPNSHSVISLPNESRLYPGHGTVKQTLEKFYLRSGDSIDWQNPLIAKVMVEFNDSGNTNSLSEVLNTPAGNNIIIHDTFLEESFGPELRKKSLTLTLLTKYQEKPLFTAVSAARLNPPYSDYFNHPEITGLQNENIDYHEYKNGESFSEIITKHLNGDVPAFSENYFKLQQIYYWLFNTNPQNLRTGQKIPIFKNREAIDKYYDILKTNFAGEKQIVETQPPEKLQDFIGRLLGPSLNASPAELRYFFQSSPEIFQTLTQDIKKSDPNSYVSALLESGINLGQSITINNVFFLEKTIADSIKEKAIKAFSEHQKENEKIFQESGIQIPEGFPFNYDFLRRVAPEPRDQITLIAIWQNEAGNEQWPDPLNRNARSRIFDNLLPGDHFFDFTDEESVGEMQTQESLVRIKFNRFYRNFIEHPKLYKKHKDTIKTIKTAVDNKDDRRKIEEMIESFLINCPEASLIAAQTLNRSNLSQAQSIAELTGTTWSNSIIHQARILANMYNPNPTVARTIEDYNRWILVAQEIGLLSSDGSDKDSSLDTEKFVGGFQVEWKPSMPGDISYESRNLDNELFYDTVRGVVMFIKENWNSNKPAIQKIKSAGITSQDLSYVLRIITENSANSLLSRTSAEGYPLRFARYQNTIAKIQEALGIDMSQVPLSAYNNINPSQAILKGNYGARALLQLQSD